ncbi:MAG: 23S rRNA (pseudouridine(1915)-N(3))-methyltransferase RlmH [Pseudohongiellaceae bacterium]|jgi:23S rRNA (pseudouridine1915-N3)-methyltransferase
MKITLLSVGTRMPRWVEEGVQEYTRRIQHELGFSVQEIPLPRRTKTTTIEQCIQKEGTAMLNKLPPADYVVALDVAGKSLDTAGLADKLGQFQSMGRNVSLLVGGPDGLHGECLARADERWSLSALTLPHPLVRILVAEQLYRAQSLRAGHPYHRQ